MEVIQQILGFLLFVEVPVFGITYRPIYLIIMTLATGLLIYMVKGGK